MEKRAVRNTARFLMEVRYTVTRAEFFEGQEVKIRAGKRRIPWFAVIYFIVMCALGGWMFSVGYWTNALICCGCGVGLLLFACFVVPRLAPSLITRRTWPDVVKGGETTFQLSEQGFVRENKMTRFEMKREAITLFLEGKTVWVVGNEAHCFIIPKRTFPSPGEQAAFYGALSPQTSLLAPQTPTPPISAP